MLELAMTVKLAAAAIAAAWIIAIIARRMTEPLFVLWAIFCTGFVSVMLIDVFDGALGPVRPLLAVASCATCSVFWLVSRALFRPAAAMGWLALVIVAGVFIPTIFDQAALVTGAGRVLGDGFVATTSDRLDGMQAFFTSLALALAFREGLIGWSTRLPAAERKMRLLFLSTFGTGVGFCLVLFDHGRLTLISPGVTAAIQSACAIAIIASMSVILRHRIRHPLAAAQARSAEPSAEDRALGQRVIGLVEAGAYLDPDLKVAELARRLHERDYKVSRAVTTALGASNFNRFINRYRIRHAKAILRDPAFSNRSILDIALESGFASLGPFNRSFREETGLTPREYRRAGTKGEARSSPLATP